MNNLLYHQLADLLSDTPPNRTALNIESALRAGAATLCQGNWIQIKATTVVCDTARDQMDAFDSAVVDIAEEYGLDAAVRGTDGAYSVRFTRPRY